MNLARLGHPIRVAFIRASRCRFSALKVRRGAAPEFRMVAKPAPFSISRSVPHGRASAARCHETGCRSRSLFPAPSRPAVRHQSAQLLRRVHFRREACSLLRLSSRQHLLLESTASSAPAAWFPRTRASARRACSPAPPLSTLRYGASDPKWNAQPQAAWHELALERYLKANHAATARAMHRLQKRAATDQQFVNTRCWLKQSWACEL